MNVLLLLLAMVALLYLFISLLLYRMQEKMIFFPEPLPPDYNFRAITGEDFEELWLPRPDGKVHGLYFPCANRRGVILYFHGNGGAMPDWVDVAPRFLQRGYDVLIMDYRGYGKSQGNLSQAALLGDADAACVYLMQQFDPSEIVVYGRSLGSGFAAYVAARHQPQKVLLETPYYSIARVAARRFPLLPVRRLIRYPMPSATFLEKVLCPVWLVHGTRDTVISHKNSRDLQAKIGPERCIYTEIPGGTHNDLDTYDAYWKWLDAALNAPAINPHTI